MDQKQTIIMLVSALLAVVAVSAVVLFLLPSESSIRNNVSTTTTSNTSVVSDGFDLNILDRSDYRALNQAPIQNGSLPVAPPATSGKANPFL